MILPETREYRNNIGPAAEIFREHGDFIYQVICSQVNSKTQADDIFQDFFLSLAHNPIPRDVENIKGYLRTAITNDIIDAVRRRDNYNNNMNRYYADRDHSIDERSPEKTLIEVEETDKLFKFIKMRLTSSQCQAMVLRHRNDLSLKEIAEEMDVKDKSVSKYIYRGLEKIRQFLKQNSDNDYNRVKP